MPFIQVFTSAPSPPQTVEDALQQQLIDLLTQSLGKPVAWIMTSLIPGVSMTFAGTRAPACYAVLKNVGAMSPEVTAPLSAALCAQLGTALGVAQDRIYVEFQNAAPHLWGWNGETFA